MIRIAQASSSENFGRYGIAPNQRRTGVTEKKPEGNLDGELNVIPWHGGWECVYRPFDEVTADDIAAFVYRAVCNGSHIGYSWSGNTGLFDALKNIGSTDPMEVKTLVNTDCAALIGAAVFFSGIEDNRLRTLTTDKMDKVLLDTGCFVKLTGHNICEKGKGIRRGDILWRSGHTACALDTDPIVYKDAVYFTKHNFNNVKITSGTPGTRAVQKTKTIGKENYKISNVRLSYVSDSSLAKVDPFMGYGDEKRLCVNFYRASGSSGTIDATVIVEYVRSDITGGSI